MKQILRNLFSGKRGRSLLAAVLVLLLAAVSSSQHEDVSGLLRLVVFDVGQGDALYIETPSGVQVVIDGGPDESILSKIGRTLPFADRSLDMLVLTHPHADHVTGLVSLLERYEVETVVFGSVAHDSAVYDEFKRVVAESGVQVVHPIRGDRFDLGDGASLQVLWPYTDNGRQADGAVLGERTYENVNNASVVMQLTYGDFDALLTGDAEYPVQEELLDEVSAVEVVKVPHQGAKDSFHRRFLERLSPELAVVSVGDNAYGHPHHDVISYLERVVPTVLRTDRNGDIEVLSNGGLWWVRE